MWKRRRVFEIILHGNATVSELRKLGRYEWSNDQIADKYFQLKKHQPRKCAVELVEFDHDPILKEVHEEFKRKQLISPTPEEALYFGIQHPNEQRKRSIVFPHQPVEVPFIDGAAIIMLYEDSARRGIDLIVFDEALDCEYLFAGVRKEKVE